MCVAAKCNSKSSSELFCVQWDLYHGHFGTLILVLITEVSSIKRSLNTLQYYTGTQNGVLIIEVPAIQMFCNSEVPLYLSVLTRVVV